MLNYGKCRSKQLVNFRRSLLIETALGSYSIPVPNMVMCEPCVGESFIALHENGNDYNRHACNGSLLRWRAGVIAAHLPCKISRHEGNVSFCHLGLSPSIASAHTDHCSEDL